MKMDMRQTVEWDVLIVGAGITGLALGMVLHRGGLRVKVMDRRLPQDFIPSPGFDARIYAMSRASERFLRLAGGWQAMDETRCQPIRAMKIYGDRLGRVTLQPGRRDPPGMGWIVEAGAMLGGLRAHQKRTAPGLLEERSLTWEAVEPLDGGLRIRAAGQTYTTRLLLACDGIQSALRDKMGLRAQFTSYGQTALVVNYRISGQHGGVAHQWFVPGGVLALLPLPGNHVSLVWSLRSDHAQAWLGMSPEQRTVTLQAQVGYGMGQFEEISKPAAFELRRMSVDRWIAPRFALVGDAAHGVHPMAGQGLNLGLEDAATLADILLRRLPGPEIGDRSLLRRYERSRREPVAQMHALAGVLNGLFARSDGPWAVLRNWGMNRLDALDGIKRELIEQANR